MQIQRSFKGEKKTGVLYLVPTPIGNREDMSYRMVPVSYTHLRAHET